MNLLNICILTQILLACAGTPRYSRSLEDTGILKYEKSKTNNQEYIFSILNTVDFGWNGDQKEDRDTAISHILHDKCREHKILEERFVETGTYGLGRISRTWFIRVHCNK